jgi:hypothetical protein
LRTPEADEAIALDDADQIRVDTGRVTLGVPLDRFAIHDPEAVRHEILHALIQVLG